MAGPRSAIATAPSGNSVTVAPGWHTAVLVALYLSVAFVGLLRSNQSVPTSPPHVDVDRVVGSYVPLILVQIVSIAYVARIGRPRGTLKSLIGTRWDSVRRGAEDLAIAFLGWLAITAIEIVWAHLFASVGAAGSVRTLLPQSPSERAMWIVVAACVGFGEEVVFRGYLQTQFAAITGRVSLAIVLQAMVFGLAHGDQGAAGAARAAIYAVGFGVMAQRRRSLVPGIACHVWTDLASGLWRI